MNFHWRRAGGGSLGAVILLTSAIAVARGQELISTGAAPDDPRFELRDGGVLPYGFAYHRQGPRPLAHPTIAPQQGWYGYGFPVSSYRWGWFGASRYYPTVRWHGGYYGDTVRWAYRRGY
jgi:hypothetical protein